MIVPGANILGLAFGAIGTQKVLHIVANGRTTNAVGNWVTSYDPPVELQASFQPIDDKKYEQLGLDMAKEYRQIWLKTPVTGIKRGESPDRFAHAGHLYEVVDVADWYGQDGWSKVLVIRIGDYQP